MAVTISGTEISWRRTSAYADTTAIAGDDAGYYDFMLIGKIGMGKSTLGNKLLQSKSADQSRIRQFSSAFMGLLKEGGKRFFQADDYSHGTNERMLSVTVKCEMLANDASKI